MSQINGTEAIWGGKPLCVTNSSFRFQVQTAGQSCCKRRWTYPMAEALFHWS